MEDIVPSYQPSACNRCHPRILSRLPKPLARQNSAILRLNVHLLKQLISLLLHPLLRLTPYSQKSSAKR
jgi:hypothetical protein